MKRLGVTVLLVAGLISSTSDQAAATTISFSSVESAKVSFSNSSFEFKDATSGTESGFDFEIVLSPLPGLEGLLGNIEGIFTIGTVTQNGLTYSSPVSGIGTFEIYDGVSDTFLAQLEWVQIQQTGTSGSLNTFAVINLSNFAYSGLNASLLELMSAPEGLVTATFQFSPIKTLQQLKNATTPQIASYSGVLTVPDGGASLSMLGLALVGIGVARSRFRS
jgi:protein with PEP-CTERM/exosortase system signal